LRIEIGCGLASYANELIKRINWSCTLILNDISHRVLKYDKRFFDETLLNPYVKIIYIACDARKLPLKNNSIECVTSFGGYENILDNSLGGIKESFRVLIPNGKCVYEMSMVEDKKSPSTKKWLHLLEIDEDKDCTLFLKEIYDLNEWHEKNKELVFKTHSITKFSDELPAPDTDKFPYSNEIARWMSLTVIIAEK
jgi:ubiquinone/menaquinone biosynthesis C-methylase UbiE